ncbi:MAG: ligand-binding sensor domain-containing protein, partial [Phycisphaerae bacterium]
MNRCQTKFPPPAASGLPVVVRASSLPGCPVRQLFTVCLIALLTLCCSAAIGAVANARGNAASSNLPPESMTCQSIHCPARFIMCMAYDRFRNAVWIGSEGSGIYEYRLGSAAAGNRWRHFSKNSGLADNSCYAIAVDRQGRVWAGTDRHGVDVYAGHAKGWMRYDVLPLRDKAASFGPLGSHPTAMAVNPKTGSIWIGEEAGISIYRPQTHTWNYLTVANGLATNQIAAIGFLPHGRVLVATQCDGLLIGRPKVHPSRQGNSGVLSALPEYANCYRWEHINGPFNTPRTAFGNGLPSALTNALFIASKGRCYLATDSGLAVSEDGGQSWRFEQGQDYAARVRGEFHPPLGFRAPPQRVLNKLLPGEHITSVAADALGNLWLGFWRNGFAVMNPKTGQIYRTSGQVPVGPGHAGKHASADANPFNYANCLLPLPDGKMLVGYYGGGVVEAGTSDAGNAGKGSLKLAAKRVEGRFP